MRSGQTVTRCHTNISYLLLSKAAYEHVSMSCQEQTLLAGSTCRPIIATAAAVPYLCTISLQPTGAAAAAAAAQVCKQHTGVPCCGHTQPRHRASIDKAWAISPVVQGLEAGKTATHVTETPRELHTSLSPSPVAHPTQAARLLISPTTAVLAGSGDSDAQQTVL